jgi:glycosyltransferase involved in cell wall biosynthesis
MESILHQTEQNWVLYIRDDGSTDRTRDIIHEYAAKYPGMIIPVRDNAGSLGCIGNFMALLAHAMSNYYMFCDQDDIWLPDKVEKTQKAMKAAERAARESGEKCALPICVHTDLEVVDGEGKTIHRSFVEKLGLDASGATFASMIYSNVVTGCTVMINQAMKELLSEVPEACMMHDQWIGLLAESCGKRVYLPEATIRYRQHGDNVMGASGRSFGDKLGKVLNISGYLGGIERTRALREKNFRQLEALYRLHGGQMKPEARETAEKLLNIRTLPGRKRSRLLTEGGYLPKDKYEALTIKLYYRWWINKKPAHR